MGIFSAHAAEIAALATALCWSFSSIFFTVGGQRVGSVVVNRARLLVAVLLVGTAHLIVFRAPFPMGAEAWRYGWLALSAILGLALGDSFLFQAYVYVGTRIAMLMMALAPVFGALLAFGLLGEKMQPIEAGAMLVALGGVGWVILERSGNGDGQKAEPRRYFLGVLCGLGGAVGQALGLVTAKQGLVGGFPALSGVMIRMTAAMAVIWLWAVIRGQVGRTVTVLAADRKAQTAIMAGAFIGPFLGVWLSLIAVQGSRIGIASTLMAMTPVMLLPIVGWVFHERISPRAVVGTLVAMAGVGVLVLR